MNKHAFLSAGILYIANIKHGSLTKLYKGVKVLSGKQANIQKKKKKIQ